MGRVDFQWRGFVFVCVALQFEFDWLIAIFCYTIYFSFKLIATFYFSFYVLWSRIQLLPFCFTRNFIFMFNLMFLYSVWCLLFCRQKYSVLWEHGCDLTSLPSNERSIPCFYNVLAYCYCGYTSSTQLQVPYYSWVIFMYFSFFDHLAYGIVNQWIFQ